MQNNEAKFSYGVSHELHYQLALYIQAKLIRVQEDKLYDVAVDPRRGLLT
ncbi:dTDP-4-dehydrorhamnose 3,5-epimerase family protein [Methanosarcina sp. T3]